MGNEHHDPGRYAGSRSVGLAAFLGLFLGGIVFFYTMPLRKALLWATVSYALVIASLGVLILPVFAGCALAAAWSVRVEDGRYGMGGSENPAEPYPTGHVQIDPTPPGLYQSVHDLMRR